MYCENCGKKSVSKDLYCRGCGNKLTTNHSTIESKKSFSVNNKKKKRVISGCVIIVLLFVFGKLLFGNMSDMEYSNNSGKHLSIVVNDITISEAWTGGSDLTVSIRNLKNKDYKDVCFVLLAWDHKGMPLKYLDGWTDQYCEYLWCDNLGGHENIDMTWNLYGMDISEIAYVSFFLFEATDFKGKIWNNPLAEYIEEYEGEKLEDISLYYFVME